MTDPAGAGHVHAVGLPSHAAAEPPPEPLVFDAVYEQHVDFVWRLVRRLGVPDASADDAVQDVFVVVHRRLADFEGRSRVRTWLYGIARRVARDHRRRVERRGGEVALEAPLIDAAPGPREAAEGAQALRVLQQILATLPDEQREVFVLAELEQMSAPEIAEATDTKLNTVYSRLRLARAAFNRAVERRGSGGQR